MSRTMRDPQCIYCQVANGDLPSTKVFEDEQLMVIKDIHPMAPVHLLIIPKDHVMRSIAEMTEAQTGLLGQMLWRAKLVAAEQGIEGDGYRLIFNVRKHAGQEVDHVHLHLLGGEPLGPIRK